MQQGGKPEKFEIPLPDEAPAPVPEQEALRAPRPMSAKGFAENTLNDAFDFLKSLYQIIPSSIKSYQENIPKIFNQQSMEILRKNPELLWTATKETASDVGHGIVEPYKKHGARVMYEKPLTVASDFLALWTLGTSSAARVGRLAGGTMTGVGKASDLVRKATALEKLPAKLAREAVDKTVLKASGGNWDLAKRRAAMTLKREELARKAYEIERDATKFGAAAGKMTDAEAEAMYTLARLGTTDMSVLAKNPNALAALKVVKEMDATLWRPYLIKHHFKTEAALDRALAKKYAFEAWGDTSVAKIDEAEAIIKKLREAEKRGEGMAPVYMPHIAEGKLKGLRSEDIIDDLVSGGKVQRTGTAKQLEEFTGKAAKYVRDPRKVVAAAIYGFRDLEAKTRFSARLLQEKALIAGKAEPLTAEVLLKSSNNPEGVWRKYYEDKIHANALKAITDPTIQRLLRWEYTSTQHGAFRIYDRIMQLFAKSATRWNPKWQTGNAIGDAVLGTLAGSDWGMGKAMRKADALPYEAVAKGGAGGLEGVEQMSRAPRWIDKAFEFGEEADKAARAGIITREAARKIKEVGYKFEASAETLEEVLKSTREFSDVQVAMQLLEEEIARRSVNVQRLDKMIANLEKREAALSRKLEGLDLRSRTKAVEKAQKADERLLTHPDGPGSDKGFVKAKTTQEAIPLGATGSPAFEKGINDINVIRQRLVNLNKKRSDIVRDIADDQIKKGALDAKIPDLKQQVEIVRGAVERANAFIGDYLGLDGFEQGVVKRLIPFYPWAKAMTMLAFRIPFLSPVKSMLWHRMSEFMSQMAEDPEMPEWMRGRVPVFAMKDGRQVWVNVSSYSPFGSLRQSSVGNIPIPQMLNIVERNPFIALGFKLFGGKTEWDTGSIPYGEPMVNMHDGSVVEFTNDGKLKKTISQTPLIQGVAHMFPTVQLAEQILTPYWTNKYDWVGLPQPIHNPDGSYRYPKELWDRLSAGLGVSVMTRSEEDIKRSNRRKVYKAITELKNMFNRSTDREEREMLREIMRDYVTENKYRQFK